VSKLPLFLMLIPWALVGIMLGRALRALKKTKPRLLIVREEKLDPEAEEE
jgi:hypothetical protein